MAIIKYRELRRRFELDGPDKTVNHFTEALVARQLKPTDFSLRDLAEGLVPDGSNWVRTLDPRGPAGDSPLEAGESVDLSAFLNVTGQVIYSAVREAYLQEAFIVSRIVNTIPVSLNEENYIVDDPSTTKHGLIIPITKEAVFFDRTNLVLSRAAEVGEVLALHKEKRLIDLIIGQTNNYKWKGTQYNTYQSSTPWINTLSTNELVDWTNVDAAEDLFAEIRDPNTNEPIPALSNVTVLAMPAYQHAANRICNGSYPLGRCQVVESRLAYLRILASGETAADAKKWWFIGDFRRAFAYMENWPLIITQSPLGSEPAFNQDILARFKLSERGTVAVLDPRYVVKCTG